MALHGLVTPLPCVGMASSGRRTVTPAAFQSAVKSSLLPVLLGEGFTLVGSDDYEMRFQRGPVVVIARYDGPREGAAILIAEQHEDERPLELGDALLATDFPEKDRWLANMQTSDADALGRLLARAAELLGEYGTPFLRDDQALFAKAYAARAARSREYTRRVSVSSGTIEAADAAWHERDYDRVLALLSAVRDRLDRTHLRRLEFAERRGDRQDSP